LVVEEVLRNGAQGWVEVAALYQAHIGEMILQTMSAAQDQKCCNKFKKLMGNPGDPKREMILRCQWVQQRIHCIS
jgi:hypothetical protein